MDGFRRMLWVGRQHSADHIPVSALQLVTRRRFRAASAKSKEQKPLFSSPPPNPAFEGTRGYALACFLGVRPPAHLNSGVRFYEHKHTDKIRRRTPIARIDQETVSSMCGSVKARIPGRTGLGLFNVIQCNYWLFS